MLFVILDCLIGGIVIYGFCYLVYQNRTKDPAARVTIITRSACVVGLLNMVLGTVYLTQYFMNPAAFSEHAEFSSAAAYWMFSIFANYFYLLAMPLSAGLIGILSLALKQRRTGIKPYLFNVVTNGTGILTIAALSCILFP